MNKNKVLQIAFNMLLQNGTIDISGVAEKTGLNQVKLNELFPLGDKELLMDTVEHAGRLWVAKIKQNLAEKNSIQEKLKALATGYALGSKDHPQSLSVYIDLWKTVKDGNDVYITKRLRDLYNCYIDEFCDIVKEIGADSVDTRELRSFSTFMTVLSDVLHVQSITLGNEINFEEFAKMIEKITVSFFAGVSDE